MSNNSSFDPHAVHVCPKCGNPSLKAYAAVETLQDSYGDWSMIIPDPDDLNESMQQPGTVVKCTNPECGIPYDRDTGVTLADWDPRLSHFENFLKHSGFPMTLKENDLNDEQAQQWHDYEDALMWDPWEGTLEECLTIDNKHPVYTQEDTQTQKLDHDPGFHFD